MVGLHHGALTCTIQLAAEGWFAMYKTTPPDWPSVPGTVWADVMKPTEDANWEATTRRTAEEERDAAFAPVPFRFRVGRWLGECILVDIRPLRL
jgi:hypothetical protein